MQFDVSGDSLVIRIDNDENFCITPCDNLDNLDDVRAEIPKYLVEDFDTIQGLLIHLSEEEIRALRNNEAIKVNYLGVYE